MWLTHQQHGLFMKQLLLQDLQVPLLLLQLPTDVLLSESNHDLVFQCLCRWFVTGLLRNPPGGTCSRSALLFSSSALRRSSSSLRRRSISSTRLFSSCSRRRCSRSCCLLISRSRRCCCGRGASSEMSPGFDRRREEGQGQIQTDGWWIPGTGDGVTLTVSL